MGRQRKDHTHIVLKKDVMPSIAAEDLIGTSDCCLRASRRLRGVCTISEHSSVSESAVSEPAVATLGI